MKGILAFPFLESRSDEEAMWRVKLYDDHQDFDCLVKRWQEPIRRLCTRMTGDAHRGEDLKQEAFLRVFEKRKDYQPKGKFSTFLWRIALNLCYDELRRVQRRHEWSLDDVAANEGRGVRMDVIDPTNPRAQLQRCEEAELVRAALGQLPEIYRTVLVLRHYENLKMREIAQVLEIPDGTVCSRMAEGLVQLTKLLEPQFGK